MELEKQVCSFALAKRLKKFGVKQESYFVWVNTDFDEEVQWFIRSTLGDTDPNPDAVSAFTVAELGEILPPHLNMKSEFFYLVCEKANTPTIRFPISSATTKNLQVSIGSFCTGAPAERGLLKPRLSTRRPLTHGSYLRAVRTLVR